MNLITRYYDPQQAVIKIDDQDIKNTSLSSLRKNISLVSQDVILFDETVKNNRAYYREKIELVVKDTKAALPEPTEEERLQNEAYARMRRKQQQLKRIKIAGFSFFGALAITATVMIYNYGAMQAKTVCLAIQR